MASRPFPLRVPPPRADGSHSPLGRVSQWCDPRPAYLGHPVGHRTERGQLGVDLPDKASASSGSTAWWTEGGSWAYETASVDSAGRASMRHHLGRRERGKTAQIG